LTWTLASSKIIRVPAGPAPTSIGGLSWIRIVHSGTSSIAILVLLMLSGDLGDDRCSPAALGWALRM